MTAKARRKLGLEKEHYHDASVMIGANIYKCNPYIIVPKRTKIWENNPTKKCKEKSGFRHMDVVKAKHRKRGIVRGSIRSLGEKFITIKTSFNNNFPVSYRKTKLVWRPQNIIYYKKGDIK